MRQRLPQAHRRQISPASELPATPTVGTPSKRDRKAASKRGPEDELEHRRLRAVLRLHVNTMEIYLRRARNFENEMRAIEIRIRAERRCAELLAEIERTRGKRSDPEGLRPRVRKAGSTGVQPPSLHAGGFGGYRGGIEADVSWRIGAGRAGGYRGVGRHHRHARAVRPKRKRRSGARYSIAAGIEVEATPS